MPRLTDRLLSSLSGSGLPLQFFLRSTPILIGLAWPFLIVHGSNSYSAWDIAVFKEWADCWGEGIYPNCRPNYPAVGLLLSGGLIHGLDVLAGISGQEELQRVFRVLLAVFDALNFLLLVWMGRLMRLRWPALTALVIAVTPSTWVGGARWGQIDNIGLFFCLLTAIGVVKSWQHATAGGRLPIPWRSAAWLTLAAVSLACYLLTKQLAVFSLPFFFILFMITAKRLLTLLPSAGRTWLFAAMGVFLLVFYRLDTLFQVPPGFHGSGYWFVWSGGGSDHANQISRNGFNLWMFLGRDMESSSYTDFLNFQIWKWRDHLSPYKAGLILYGLLILTLTRATLMRVYRILPYSAAEFEIGAEQGELMAVLWLFHGLCHLGLNVLMTGTHERYLYLGYPGLLLAAVWFHSNGKRFGWRMTAFCFLAAAAYGGFVFSVNAALPQLLFPLRRHEFIASVHLFLLVVLVERYWQILRSVASREDAFRAAERRA